MEATETQMYQASDINLDTICCNQKSEPMDLDWRFVNMFVKDSGDCIMLLGFELGTIVC